MDKNTQRTYKNSSPGKKHVDTTVGDLENNFFNVLNTDDLGGNGGHDVFDGKTKWKTIQSKKRKIRSSKDSDSCMNSEMSPGKFKSLPVDEKLSVLFTKFGSQGESMRKIEAKLDQCLQIQGDIPGIKSSLDNHEDRLALLEYKSIDIESRSRRNNLIFVGFLESRDEDCTRKINSFVRDDLQIESQVGIERAHRLGRFKPGFNRPIIVAFRAYPDTQLILSNAYKLKNTRLSINRDFPQENLYGHNINV